jgi:hypothetical protein
VNATTLLPAPTSIEVFVLGGGGGGGKAATTSVGASGGSGGGGTYNLSVGVTAGITYAVTVGGGGAGGGGNGNPSTFGSSPAISVVGGNGGLSGSTVTRIGGIGGT